MHWAVGKTARFSNTEPAPSSVWSTIPRSDPQARPRFERPICAPLREHLAVNLQRCRRIGSRGDAEVLRSGRTKHLQTSSEGRQSSHQPEPPRHTRAFSAPPREPVLLAVTVCDDGRFCSREGAKTRRYGAWISAHRLSQAAKNLCRPIVHEGVRPPEPHHLRVFAPSREPVLFLTASAGKKR